GCWLRVSEMGLGSGRRRSKAPPSVLRTAGDPSPGGALGRSAASLGSLPHSLQRRGEPFSYSSYCNRAVRQNLSNSILSSLLRILHIQVGLRAGGPPVVRAAHAGRKPVTVRHRRPSPPLSPKTGRSARSSQPSAGIRALCLTRISTAKAGCST